MARVRRQTAPHAGRPVAVARHHSAAPLTHAGESAGEWCCARARPVIPSPRATTAAATADRTARPHQADRVQPAHPAVQPKPPASRVDRLGIGQTNPPNVWPVATVDLLHRGAKSWLQGRNPARPTALATAASNAKSAGFYRRATALARRCAPALGDRYATKIAQATQRAPPRTHRHDWPAPS